MYDRHLDSFIAAADCGSFSKAAERVYVSPNALIKQINLLEHRLGVTLFHRTPRGITLTEAGKSVYGDAITIRRLSLEAIERAKRISEARSVVIRLGTSLMCPARPALRLWAQVSARHPGVKVEITPVNDSLHENLSPSGSGNIGVDVIAGIIPSSLWDNTCDVLEISREPVALAMPLTHPLAALPVIRNEDLFGQRVFVVQRHDSSYIDRLRDYWEQNFPQIRIETVPPYDISVFNRCAAEGAVMVSTPFWTDVHPSLMTVPYEKGGDFTVPYGLVFAKHPAPHVAQFVQFMREAVAQSSASS